MKKALFLLGAVAAMGFVACNPTSDCDCTVTTDMGVSSEVVVASITEFDGECSEITSSTEGLVWDEIWADYAGDETVTMVCEQK